MATSQPPRLAGKVAIVSGAGSIGPGWGNGKATAVAFARAGAKVLAVDQSAEAVQETCAIICGEGGCCEAFVADVACTDGAAGMVAHCIAHFGGVDILHNNIGIMVPGGPCELPEEEWDRVVSVNLRTLFLACKHSIPHMLERGAGVILNVGSVGAMRYLGLPAIAYATTKAGVAAFSSMLAAQYGPSGIRVNTIVPGIVDTPVLATAERRIAAARGDASQIDAARAARKGTVPLRRFGQAWDVANAAVYLASEEAAYVTGASLVVDGGLSCMAP